MAAPRPPAHAVTEVRTWATAHRRRILVALAALGCAIGACLWTVPKVHVDASPTFVATFPLDRSSVVPKERHSGTIEISRDGYVIGDQAAGEVRVPVRVAAPRSGRLFARIWAYGRGDVDLRADLLAADGSVHPIGKVGHWVGHDVDVTDVDRRRGPWSLRVRVDNPTLVPTLFLDQLQIVSVPAAAAPTASRWLAALWVAVLLAAALALTARLRRHWPLPVAAAILVFVMWPDVIRHALEPLDPTTEALWGAARESSWFELEQGILSGTFGPLSALTVQLLHGVGAVTGYGLASGRSASLIVAVIALAAVYALSYRVAGRVGGVAALIIMLVIDPVRTSAISAEVPVLLLAGALLAYGVHCCLANASPVAMAILGALAALACLAVPVLLPGAIVAIAIIAGLCGAQGHRMRSLGIGLLLFTIVLLPSRVSLASQHDGDLLADLRLRATYARNVDFAGRRSEAPTRAEFQANPYTGPSVGLLEYTFGEHRLSVVAGSALHGANEAVGAFAARPTTGLAGLIAFLVTLAGGVYVLLVPRLRLLVVVPFVALIFVFFLAGRGALAPIAAGALWWPALVAAAGALIYALHHAYLAPRLPRRWRLIRPAAGRTRRARQQSRPATRAARARRSAVGRAPTVAGDGEVPAADAPVARSE